MFYSFLLTADFSRSHHLVPSYNPEKASHKRRCGTIKVHPETFPSEDNRSQKKNTRRPGNRTGFPKEPGTRASGKQAVPQKSNHRPAGDRKKLPGERPGSPSRRRPDPEGERAYFARIPKRQRKPLPEKRTIYRQDLAGSADRIPGYREEAGLYL